MAELVYIAHRGLHDEVIPENSILAFKKALKKKMAIELDLQLTKDGEVVVFHDRNLKRMTGFDKRVDECFYKDIKGIKLKDSKETIPLLQDVLKLVAGKVFLDIEIKHYKKARKLVNRVSNISVSYTHLTLPTIA